MSLESGDIPSRIWIAIGVALIASAFTDVLIVGAEWAGYTALRPWIISVYSVGSLFLIGALSLSDHLQVRSDEEQIIDPEQTESDARILEKLNHHMTQAKPYLDPDLTLIKLARKLGIPSKTLSAAVNRATGENMSRYVNNARIRAAQEALKAGENVTGAMLTSGFNTKSNFNREFLRVAGMSPKKWSEANP
jgi:AraC-like DNA-binding protein